MKTKVIFRKFPTGDIIALFPEIPADHQLGHCQSYQQIGQHGAASTSLPNTSPAKPDEYADLQAELERIGYTLEIRRNITSRMDSTRWSAMRLK